MRKSTAILVVSSLALSACTTDKTTSKQGNEEVVTLPHIGHGAILSDQDVVRYKAKAEKGDGEAANRLAAHYGIGLGDAPQARKYRQMAVALEYPPALYGEAIRVWASGSGDRELALKLLKRAIELGHKDTANLAAEIK
ncbi:MAG: hypothetical protein PHQ04_01520 [Opitutaceae bacterium]|nr:hypothetical protein [Opitutaceae bacterium]